MRRIQTKISTQSDEYLAHYAYNAKLAEDLRTKNHQARWERPARDMERLARQNKMFPRERLEALLDPGTPFLELSTLAANQAYDGESPGASCITGIGIVSGKEVVIHAGDSSVKGGAWYPLTIKKIVRGMDIAIENRLPVIHLCDSAGGFLPLQSQLFGDKYMAGRIFRNQATLSKMGVPQLSLVFGHCTAGGAYVPALSDYSVIVRGMGAVFLGGPPLVKAATGEVVGVEELGGADAHTSISGTCDYPADSELHAIEIGREIVARWQQPTKAKLTTRTPMMPYYDPTELYGILPDRINKPFDMHEIIARIVDGSEFHEYQPNYGTSIVCGFAYIWGMQVGILANNGVLFNDSSLKATHFMELCNQNGTPLVFLQNITGYMVGKEYEMRGITKDGAKMIMMQVGSEVPKITVMCNGSFGAGNYGMCGRAFDSRLLFAWPNSQISVMGAEQAAKTLLDIKINQLSRHGEKLSDAQAEEIRQSIMDDYLAQSNAYYSTSEVWDDGLLDPVDTRNAIAMSLSAAINAPIGGLRAGVFRM